MSRTFRKRYEKCWVETIPENEELYYFGIYFKPPINNNNKWKEQKIAQFKTRSDKHITCKFPKLYRKYTNKRRKSYDRQELFREINIQGYEPLYSLWNCKTADPDWYW